MIPEELMHKFLENAINIPKFYSSGLILVQSNCLPVKLTCTVFQSSLADTHVNGYVSGLAKDFS